jgi:hypothetical protein
MTPREPLTGDGGYRRRFAAAFAISAVLHAVLLLLVMFEVVGSGGGFGIGVGPGVGLGTGGGVGLGEKGRQIYALHDPPAEVQRQSHVEDRLTQMIQPQAPVRPTVAPIEQPTMKKLAVVPMAARPKRVALVPNVRGQLARSGSAVGGLGGGGGGGLGISFGRYVGGLRRKGLDVVIVIDATGSMQHIIDEVKDRMVDLVRSIQKLVPTARVGAVAFRDRPDDTASAPRSDDDFVVKWSDLTFNGPKVQAFLGRVQAGGGGDWEEAVREGIDTAIAEMSWRPGATKVMILVGSSPPHQADKIIINRLAERFRNQMGGTISTIDVTERLHEEHERRMHKWLHGTEPEEITPLPDFYKEVQASYREIASVGGGEMLTLDVHQTLVRHLLVLTFGTKWQDEVARIARGM